MLPSMPCISTPFKEQTLDNGEGTSACSHDPESDELESDCSFLREDQTLITSEQEMDIALQRQSPTKALDLSTTGNVSSKKSSPLKHVTPILKKYSSQRKSKGSKKVALLGKGGQQQQQQENEKPTLRAIAPKPVVVLLTPPQQDATSEGTENTAMANADIPAEAKEDCMHTTMTNADAPSEAKEEISAGATSERKDNEDELAALMLASTTIRTTKTPTTNAMRKKSKQMRNMQTTLTLLAPDPPSVREEKSHGFAQAYFMKVQERLEGTELLNEFLDTMNDFGNNILDVSDLYWKVTSVLSQHQDLCEEFLAFLLPEQAMQIGKFMEHLMVTKMRDFFRKLEIYFAKQPQQMQKIYAGLMALGNQASVTIQDVRSTMLPLLKGNSLLVDSFLSLLPEERPPESCMTEFEEMECAEVESDHSGDDELFETVQVPDQEDVYGGDACACVCHASQDDKYRARALHCVKCGTRFIHGKVFLQTGKVLRPAKVIFQNESSNDSVKRLRPKAQPRSRSRKKAGVMCGINKDISPMKQSHSGINSDDHRTDQDEHDAAGIKSKTMSPKSARGAKARAPHSANKARATSVKASTKNSPTEKKETLNSRLVTKSGSVRQSRTGGSSCNKQIAFISQPVVSLRDIGNDISPSLLAKHSARGSTISTTSKCVTKYSPAQASSSSNIHSTGLCQDISQETAKPSESPVKNEDSQEIMECSMVEVTPEVKMEVDVSCTEEGRTTSWTREEDKTILQMFQLDCSAEQAFVKISEHLPQRSLSEIQNRFHTLMKLLQQMTEAKMEEDVSSSNQ